MAWKYELDSPGYSQDYHYQETGFSRVAVDSRGDVLACGTVYINGQPPARVRLVKLSGESGQLLWSVDISGSMNIRALSEDRALFVDDRDDVIIGGTFTVNEYYGAQFVLIKVSGVNGRTIWSRWMGDPDSHSNFNAAALSRGGDVIGLGRIIQLGNHGFEDSVIKFSADRGLEDWNVSLFGPTVYGNPVASAVDAGGDVLVAGYSYLFPNFDTVVSKRSGEDGSQLWRYEVLRPDLAPWEVALDGSGDIILSTSAGILKLSGGNGDLMWAHLAPQVGNNSVDSSGNLIVTTFGSDELFKLDGSTGGEIWRVSGTIGGWVGGVSIDEADDAALAGATPGPAGGLAVSKVSGLDGRLLWQRVIQDERGGGGDCVTTDQAGDVIACGVLEDIYHDPYYGDVLNSKGVVVKLWGRTGADFPPTALEILRALSDAVTALNLPPGLEHSLVKQVDSASTILSDGNPSNDSTAVSPLRLFISHVSALRRQVIDSRSADELISLAQRAIAALTGT